MPVVLVTGILAILVGVFYVAIGRGGELAYEQADHAPLDLGPVSATDVALLRPPTALWGYNMQVTDEALDRIARALRDRDILIASLQRQLSDGGRGTPAVTSIDPDVMLGATGLTQAARWDEVIIATDGAALDEASVDEPATDLDGEAGDTAEQTSRFVPRHERPPKAADTTDEPEPSDFPDKPDDDAEEHGW